MAYILFSNFINAEELKNSSLSSLDIINLICETDFYKFNFNKEKKCDKISKDNRLKGNIYFNNNDRDMKRTYWLYTKALFNAKTNIEKAYNFGNRSGVLFKMGLYDSCLKDIEFAIEFNYPKDKICKLLLRKIEALIMIGNFDDATKCINDLHLHLEPSFSGFKDFEQRLSNARNQCVKRKPYDTFPSKVTLKQSYSSETMDIVTNKDVKAFTEKLSLLVNDTEGRYVVANDDIEIGEILAVETPYSYRLTVDNMMTHCYYCLQQNINLRPCDRCSWVGFCDKQCQQLANEVLRHDLECGFMGDILSTPSNELGLLAYGLASRTSPDIVRASVHRLRSGGGGLGDGIVDSGDYRSVLSVTTNEHARSPDDLCRRCISAVFLALCLVKRLFPDEECVTEREWLHTYSVALVAHLQGIPCNAHSLSEHTVPKSGSVAESVTNYVGNGLYPCLSMLNHACSPNVVRVTMARGVCVLRAATRMAKGQQIYDNYSVHFATMDRQCRQQVLRDQYHFQCECDACRGQWPTFETQLEMEGGARLRCGCAVPSVSGDWSGCPGCGLSLGGSVSRLVTLCAELGPVMAHLVGGESLGQVETYLVEVCSLVHVLVTPPSLVHHQVAEMLKLLWTMHGCSVTSWW